MIDFPEKITFTSTDEVYEFKEQAKEKNKLLEKGWYEKTKGLFNVGTKITFDKKYINSLIKSGLIKI